MAVAVPGFDLSGKPSFFGSIRLSQKQLTRYGGALPAVKGGLLPSEVHP
jgi:hypothetical protein